MDAAEEHLFSRISAIVPAMCKMLTLKEAINGNPNYEYIDGLKMNSSVGYPYNKTGSTKDKHISGEIGEMEITDLYMLHELNEAWEAMKRGERSFSVWIINLKDELRGLDKILAGKTRAISCCPIIYLINFKRACGAFCAFMHTQCLSFGSAVGIDIHGPDFTTLYQKLTSKNTYGFAGDYGCFDGTLMPELMWRAGNIMKRWYQKWLPEFNEISQEEIDEHMLIIDVLMEECIHAVELCGNLVYTSIQGNKSGNPWTALINSLVNIMYSYCAWKEICRETGNYHMLPLSCFDDNVEQAIYGDDNILATTDEALEFFNAVNFSTCMANHGIEYTNESKTGVIIPFRKLENCTFLKNGFRRDDDYPMLIHPTMSMKTIRQLINWVRKSDDDWDAWYQNCGDALEFIFHYGRDEFDKFKSEINNHLSVCRKPLLTTTFDDLQSAWLDKFGINN